MVGSPIVALGFRFDGDRGVIDCPPVKQAAVLADAAEQRERAASRGQVLRRQARRLVGRLCNLSQVEPALRPLLHGGYTVVEATWPGSDGVKRRPPIVTLADGGETQLAFLEMLDVAQQLVGANEGAPMAPRLVAPSRLAAGSLTSVTDASGDDGFGGYAFAANSPTSVYVLSEPWEDWARAALAASADPAQADVRRRDATNALPHLVMPAAELFAAVVLPRAVARVSDVSLVYAVGDCEPAAFALDTLHSPKTQMRALLRAAGEAAWPWLSAQVPREANVDADRLSHPQLYDSVRLEAEMAGLTVVRVRPEPEDWELLRSAIAAANLRPRPRKRRRHSGSRTAA